MALRTPTSLRNTANFYEDEVISAYASFFVTKRARRGRLKVSGLGEVRQDFESCYYVATGSLDSGKSLVQRRPRFPINLSSNGYTAAIESTHGVYMCGVSGILYKRARSDGPTHVGNDLVMMLEPMTHRGKDSSGVTIMGEKIDGDLVIRIWTEDVQDIPLVVARSEETVRNSGGVIQSTSTLDRYLRLVVNYQGDVADLADALIKVPGVAIHSIGATSEVIKDVGTPAVMDVKHGIGEILGTHGIGHVRMATESKVDVNHAHPFWAYPFPDVTVVHNGQLTNYHKLKRVYEDQGHHFQTGNDSELIAVYLAAKLSEGLDLNQALRSSLDDLDGTFTYLVATKDGIGYAKDRWSAKPLVTMETDDVIAIASEEISLRGVFTEEIELNEPQNSEVMTWLL